jgi:putative transposase
MLSREDLLVWYRCLGLSEEARAVVDRVRSADPSRRVESGRGNVSGRYPSRKMGVTIQFESHRVELAGIYEMEHDGDVLEYYDQPPSIELRYPSAKGRQLVVAHTPDYFVIRTNAAGWEEWKTEEDLNRLTRKNRHRYVLEGEQRWCCPPGEGYAIQLGLYYRVRSSREIDWLFQRNIQFLEDYLRFDSARIPPSTLQRVLAYVSACPAVTLQELLEEAKRITAPDDVYFLIATGKIYVDLRAAALAEPAGVRVFACREAALAHAAVSTEHSALHASSSIPQAACVTARPTQGPEPSKLAEELFRASEEDLKVANYRADIVRRHLQGASLSAGEQVPARTLRRWLSRYRTADCHWGAGYLGLLPRRRPGNPTPRLPGDSVQLMNEIIETQYEQSKQKNCYVCWIALRRACEQGDVVTPSYTTFCSAVRRRAGFHQTLKRKGHRAAYSQEPFYFELSLMTPRHGDRPFEICHTDHTHLDVELTDPSGKHLLGRPWMTLMLDAFSRRVLAVHVDFDAPSYRSCMIVLRECVRLHNRLPDCLVVDGGPEFKSTYFETLLARYECTKKTRPRSKSRFGSVIERFFGTTNTQFIHNLLGNTQITRNVRQVTRSVNPKGQAIWTVTEFYDRLCHYMYKIYNAANHPALGHSPEEALRSGLSRTGLRPQRAITYDEDFLIFTLPTTTKGTAKVSPGRGVKINCIYYWSDVFRDPEVEQQQVAVRYDPFDAGTAYSFVGNHWVRCHSEHYTTFQSRSEKEVKLATQELRSRHQDHARQFKTGGKQLAEFLQSVEADEALLTQRLRDRDGRHLRAGISGMTPVDGSPTPSVHQNFVSPVQPPGEETGESEIYGEF